MKIAFVYDAVYPWVKGGAEMRIHELGKRFVKAGHEIHLFGIKWWEGEDILEHEGMTLHGVCQARELYVDGRRSIPEALAFSAKLFPKLIKENFDLIDVSVFPYFSCFTVKKVSYLKNTPVVYTWHEVWDDYWYEYLGRAGFFGKVIERAVARISENCIAVSEFTKTRLEALGVPGEKIAVVPNGIDFKRISRIKPEERSFAGSEERVYDLIFAGRLIKEKNVDILIKATALLKNDFPGIKCCIIGNGPEKESLEKLAQKLGLQENLEFAGFQEYDALIGKLKASKVLVLPSSREGFGMIVIEAFACGVPVVTVREKYNAAQGLVENGVNGFVVGLEEGEIAKSVNKILQIDNAYMEMTENTIKKAKDFDWDRLATELLSIYEEFS